MARFKLTAWFASEALEAHIRASENSRMYVQMEAIYVLWNFFASKTDIGMM